MPDDGVVVGACAQQVAGPEECARILLVGVGRYLVALCEQSFCLVDGVESGTILSADILHIRIGLIFLLLACVDSLQSRYPLAECSLLLFGECLTLCQ